MNSEESYLDSLLRNILNPEAEEPRKEESQIDTVCLLKTSDAADDLLTQ